MNKSKSKSLDTLASRLDVIHDDVVPIAVEALRAAGRALVTLPTGTGKTRIAFRVAKEYLKRSNKKLLILSHKTDLTGIDGQTLAVFKALWPERSVGFLAAASDLHKYDVLVGTNIKTASARMLSELDLNRIGLVVIDECHRAPTGAYRRWLEFAKVLPHLGLTATPIRPDDPDKTLVTDIFGEPVYSLTVKEAIEQRVYANPNATSRLILTKSVLEGVVKKNGEWREDNLRTLVISESRNRTIVSAYKRYGRKQLEDRGLTPKTVCFCIDTQHAKAMSELFNEHFPGKVAMVVGDAQLITPKQRKETLERFRTTNDIEILCAVNILNEGIDVPDVNCLLMVRPTRSCIIYIQQLGRACRFIDGVKEDFIVLDFVDNATRGFNSYVLSNVTGTTTPRQRIITEYVDSDDPAEVNNRVDVLSNVSEWELGRPNIYYATAEEAYAACIILGITSYKTYCAKYKNDIKLYSIPSLIYPNWSFGVLSGYPRRHLYSTKEEAYEACRKLEIRNSREYLNKYKEDVRLPSTPERVYENWTYSALSGHRYFSGPNRLTYFYDTKEEAYEACRKLEINGHRDYKLKYKANPKLPSNPTNVYTHWNYSVLSGRSKYKDSLSEKQKLLALAMSGAPRPKGKRARTEIRRHLKLDLNFYNELQKVAPAWLTRPRRKLEYYLAHCPKEVTFKQGQHFNNLNDTHVFIHSSLGEFSRCMANIVQSWKIGLSGHPKDPKRWKKG